jgi:hypothetical protein
LNVDVDALTAALEPPSITISGQSYAGRVLSVEEWDAFAPRLKAAAGGTLEPKELRLLIYQYVGAVFPKPWWKFWSRSVAWRFLQLPPQIQIQAFTSFFQSQMRAMGLEAMQPVNATPGNN